MIRLSIAVVMLALILLAIVAVATTPSTQWNNAANGVLIPPCASGAPKHWSTITNDNVNAQAAVWDAYKANSYTNIRLDITADGILYMNADCTLGT